MALWIGSEVGVIALVLLVGYLVACGVEREWVGAPDEPDRPERGRLRFALGSWAGVALLAFGGWLLAQGLS